MPLVTEKQETPLSGSLRAGIESIDRNAVIQFTQYTIVRTQQDGYVFWVAGASQGFPGSLHYATETEQDETGTTDVNTVVFTSSCEVEVLNTASPTKMWVAPVTTPGGNVIYVAFRGHGRYYEPAQVWHYYGTAVLPDFQRQLVSSASDIPVEPICSNSTPIWLSQTVPLGSIYPSFLVPANVVPPYVVVHIDRTDALSGFPRLVPPPTPAYQSGSAQLYTWPSSQLMKDTGRLSVFGYNNAQALQLMWSLIEASRNTDAFGFMASPAFIDGHDVQPEIQATSMCKTLAFEVSYYLTTADALSRRYILSAAVSSTIN